MLLKKPTYVGKWELHGTPRINVNLRNFYKKLGRTSSETLENLVVSDPVIIEGDPFVVPAEKSSSTWFTHLFSEKLLKARHSNAPHTDLNASRRCLLPKIRRAKVYATRAR